MVPIIDCMIGGKDLPVLLFLKGGLIIHKVLDEGYYDLIVERSLEGTWEGYAATNVNSRYILVHIPAAQFNPCVLGTLPYHIFPTIYSMNSAISLESSGVSQIQSNTNLALLGQGVLIGFVDTGIQYWHEAFLNNDGTSKIFSIWDQTVEEGTPPPYFSLGSEYSQAMINLALKADDPLSVVPSTDDTGHGTMMAGIAAGSRNYLHQFRGAAPQAELIMVKIAPAKKYNKRVYGIPDSIVCYPESNILLGVEYIRAAAQQQGKPLILCLGFGSSQGDHDGHNVLARVLDSMSTLPGLAICVSAGNEGNNRRHFRGVIPSGEKMREFDLRIGAGDKEFSLELWQKSPGRQTVSVVSPGGESIPAVFPGFNTCTIQKFILEPSILIINNFIIEEETGEQLILVRFEDALPGVWRFRINSLDNLTSEFNVWLPAEDLISSETYFLKPDPGITVTSPGNAHNPLTVTAYNQLTNSILISSSRGYTASGDVKPDIAAPGYSLTCPVPDGGYGNVSGTGAAAAHTAGIMAMLMEWTVIRGNYTTITGRDIGRLLIRGARRDENRVYPNPVWGYGQIDILGVFRSLIQSEL